MRIHLYKQYVNNHPEKHFSLGELTEQSIINHFRLYPWDEEQLKNEQFIEAHGIPHLLLKRNNYRFYIYANDQNTFDVTIRKGLILTKLFTSENNQPERIEELIRLFFSLNFKQFITELKPTETNRILDLTGGVSVETEQEWKLYSIYETKHSRIFGKMLTPFMFYLLSIIALIVSIKAFLIAFFGITLFLSPAIIILVNHLSHSQNKSLKFFRRNNEFRLTSNQTEIILNKENIKKLIYHDCKMPRAPWGDFEYTEFVLNNEKSFMISSFIIDKWELWDELHYTEKETVTEWFQRIKDS